MNSLIRSVAITPLILLYPTSSNSLVINKSLNELINVHSIDWEPQESFISNGVRIYLLRFNSSMEVSEVARALSGHTNVFQKVMMQPGHLVMSGIHEGNNWVAYIYQRKSDSAGYISLMPVHNELEQKSSLDISLTEAFKLFSGYKYLSLDQYYRVDKYQVRVRMFTYQLNSLLLQQIINKHLTNKGWQLLDTNSNKSLVMTWKLNTSRINIQILQTGIYSQVLTQHIFD